MKITWMKYWEIVDKNFYCIGYNTDRGSNHLMNLSAWKLPLDMSVADGVAYLLRAELDCVPIDATDVSKAGTRAAKKLNRKS